MNALTARDLPSMDNQTIARMLASKLFELGSLYMTTPCQRIQFMCGTYPGGEVPAGGMCEEALVKHFAKTLDGLGTHSASEKS